MFKKTTATILLLASSVIGTSANATEVSLEKFIGNMLTQAVNATKQEIQYGLEEAILTANNAISFDESETYAAKVSISEISEKVKDDKAE